MRIALRSLDETGPDTVEVRSQPFLIGRAERSDLRLYSLLVSKTHCELLIEDDSLIVRDLHSTNGTYVNGERIWGDHQLNDGDILIVAILPFEVQIGRDPKSGSRMRFLEASPNKKRTGSIPML